MTFAITGRFVRRVCPVQYEHGEAEVSFSTTVEVDDVAVAAAKANEMLTAAKDLVLSKLGRKPGTDTAQMSATEVPAAAAAAADARSGSPVVRQRLPPLLPAAAPAPAPAAPAAETNEFGEAATEAKPAADEFGETAQPEADEFAEAAAAVEQPKPMEAKELQALISGHIQAKRISADKVREVMKAFRVARTDDTTPEMRPLIVAEIEKIIKGKK
jgi:hypothetical protein